MPGIAYGKPVEHVLLLSIDGFHDFDLTNYVATHRTSALALLVARGTVYEQAWSPAPSDSFPATLAMVTGGSRLIPVRPSRTSTRQSCRSIRTQGACRSIRTSTCA